MSFFCLGIDHKSASPDIRQAAHAAREEITGSLGRNARALYTCNRVELYGTARDHRAASRITGRIRERFPGIFGSAYAYYDRKDIFRHGLRLACGLESQLQGEREIMDQLRVWAGKGGFPEALKMFWEDIIVRAGEIRMHSGIYKETPNIADLVFKDLGKRMDITAATTIVVIGTGHVAALIAERAPRVKLQFVSRKKRPKAVWLAALTAGNVFSPEALPALAVEAGAVISATASPHTTIKAETLSMAAGRTSPLFIYDLAVPSDIADDVRGVPFARVTDIGSLVLRYGSAVPGQQLAAVNALIEQETDRYRGVYNEKAEDRYAAERACPAAG